MARNEVANDPFTGAAGAPDAAWSTFRNQNIELDGSGNALVGINSSTEGAFRNTGTYASNQYSEVTATAGSVAGHNIDLIVRAQSLGNGYAVLITTSTVDIYKVVSSSFNLVSNVATGQTWVADDKFSLEVSDNGSNQPVFKVFKNTTQIGSDITDTGASPYTGGRPGVMLRQDSAPSVKITYWSGGDVVAGVTGTMATTLSAFTMTANGTVGTAPKRAVFSTGAANELRDANQSLVTQSGVPYAVYKASLLTALGTVIETGTVNVSSGACTINISSASVIVGDTVTILFDDGTNRATRTLVTT